MYVMLPIDAQPLLSVGFNGNAVAFTKSTIKGIVYALFPAHSGRYVATYAAVPSPAASVKN
jgi:hypothetical protein